MRYLLHFRYYETHLKREKEADVANNNQKIGILYKHQTAGKERRNNNEVERNAKTISRSHVVWIF